MHRWYAMFLAARGQLDEAAAWLDTIGVDPRFEPPHGDLRFKAILGRLHIAATAA